MQFFNRCFEKGKNLKLCLISFKTIFYPLPNKLADLLGLRLLKLIIIEYY